MVGIWNQLPSCVRQCYLCSHFPNFVFLDNPILKETLDVHINLKSLLFFQTWCSLTLKHTVHNLMVPTKEALPQPGRCSQSPLASCGVSSSTKIDPPQI
jgi:hypothetical protein